jgi:uncharacterized protein (DUF2344 family)
VQWLRVRYAKRGRARFTSHRDFGRAFERRAAPGRGLDGVLVRVLTASTNLVPERGAPPGAASEAEYLEIGLAAACDPDKVKEALDAALPPASMCSTW